MALCVVSYEDRLEAMDSLILMGESLCRVDSSVLLRLTVPDAPQSVLSWAASRPQQVEISTARPEGVRGWDVKPWLLLQELNAGRHEAMWLDDDIIVTGPISSLIKTFPPDSVIVAQEWDTLFAPWAPPMSHYWGMRSGRRMPTINACVLRVCQSHRPLLERYLEMTKDPAYREVQARPMDQRPRHMLGDTPILTAALESEQFSDMPFDCLLFGKHIAQCAGSSGYPPAHRFLDLFRGLPPLIHGIGRKPWDPLQASRPIERFMLDFATDLSPYVLASKKVAKTLNLNAEWLEPRTVPGALLRGLTGGHPALAGLPLAILHSFQSRGDRPVDKVKEDKAASA
jgi:hypothetical protein